MSGVVASCSGSAIIDAGSLINRDRSNEVRAQALSPGDGVPRTMGPRVPERTKYVGRDYSNCMQTPAASAIYPWTANSAAAVRFRGRWAIIRFLDLAEHGTDSAISSSDLDSQSS